MTKVMALLSITDDIYDVYETSAELQSFIDMIMRRDEEAAQQLKEYWKVHFHNLTKALQDFDNEISSHGKSYPIKYLKVVVRAWNEEVKWRDDGYIPTLRENLEVSTVTNCYNLLTCASFIGMGTVVMKEVFDWKRNHVASTVQCYMKEHSATLDHACEELLKMVEHAWKSLNHEFLNLSGTFSRDILIKVINLARVIETSPNVQDKYTHSALIKDHISILLVELVSI
ncbi:hypothetical protein M5K25_000334 [Dendrobium thyrsiflorum]|uniref:Terpene synthase metal-binding domain-containing protein n=1 Tax=Dendrobium thyrsiflorum TaxID=117978 RepID=A0ABD0WAI3_DENTH